ncbi:hypothetical protein [Virgibacillus proomii]|uniref:hypothetical protein n=1 Tax=Virgibacillus proomii TaxID=84407 RepID=UPI0015C32242|nr:hypothetical protein [Virgibacillus proomii]
MKKLVVSVTCSMLLLGGSLFVTDAEKPLHEPKPTAFEPKPTATPYEPKPTAL